jgi:hypothetical protein
MGWNSLGAKRRVGSSRMLPPRALVVLRIPFLLTAHVPVTPALWADGCEALAQPSERTLIVSPTPGRFAFGVASFALATTAGRYTV